MEYEWNTTITSPHIAQMMKKMLLQYSIMLETKEYQNQLYWNMYRDKRHLNDLEINLLNN